MVRVRVMVMVNPPRTKRKREKNIYIWLEAFVGVTSAGDDCRWYWLLLVS